MFHRSAEPSHLGTTAKGNRNPIKPGLRWAIIIRFLRQPRWWQVYVLMGGLLAALVEAHRLAWGVQLEGVLQIMIMAGFFGAILVWARAHERAEADQTEQWPAAPELYAIIVFSPHTSPGVGPAQLEPGKTWEAAAGQLALPETGTEIPGSVLE